MHEMLRYVLKIATKEHFSYYDKWYISPNLTKKLHNCR